MSMSNRDKKLGPPPRWVNCPRKGHLVQGKHLIDTHVLLVGVRINTGIPVYCGTWTKNMVSRYIFSILVYRLNWWSLEFCYGLGITKFWFELNGWCICYCPKHEKKSWRYGHISVSVHKLTTKMFYSSILYRLIVQINYVYKSKSITVY